MWLCNPKGFSVFIPLQPENILIELPTLLICISLASAPGSGFCCVPSPLEHLLPLPISPLSQASPHATRGVWPMGATWPRWSIPPSPRALPQGSPVQAGESKGNISVVASGCSWLPPFPWMLGARAPLGLPQLRSRLCLQLSLLLRTFPMGAPPG